MLEVVLFLTILIRQYYCDILASSTINQCTQTEEEGPLNCDTKVVVTVTVENAQVYFSFFSHQTHKCYF